MVRRDPETGAVTIPDWQLAAIITVLIAVSGAIGTGVSWVLWDHNTTINQHATTLATHTQQLRSIETQGDKVDIKLTRIDEKIDRMFDEIRKK